MCNFLFCVECCINFVKERFCWDSYKVCFGCIISGCFVLTRFVVIVYMVSVYKRFFEDGLFYFILTEMEYAFKCRGKKIVDVLALSVEEVLIVFVNIALEW